MSKNSFANENVMEEYLGTLLQEEPDIVVDEVQQQSVSRLLQTVDKVDVDEKVPHVEQIKKDVEEAQLETKKDSEPPQFVNANKGLSEPFQALYFELAGLTMAVPLTHLGGIHQLEKVNPLFGKPDWFRGVMLHREEKLSVVDTACWVMPEKYDEKLAESINYQYLITLNDSNWGLACERLINTVTLQPEEVKWRSGDGKRPWLSGMVKDKMCALINVEHLIVMLNQGMGSNEA
jgi:purine-binding chemotaxis protein CheW